MFLGREKKSVLRKIMKNILSDGLTFCVIGAKLNDVELCKLAIQGSFVYQKLRISP